MITRRKIALLASVAVLALVYAFQLALTRPESVKTLAAESAIDSIEIATSDERTIVLSKEGEAWYVGESRYPADPSRVEAMLSLLNAVKVLGTVASDASRGEYGLEEGSAVSVTALSGGRTIRSVLVGKGAVNSMQTYARVDDARSVSLLSGNYRGAFGLSVDEIRSREVWTIDAQSVTRVASDRPSLAFSLEKAGDPPAWTLSRASGAASVAIDAEKANAWVNGLLSVKAQSFARDGAEIPEGVLCAVTISAGGVDYWIRLHGKGDDGTYLCTAGGVSSPFYPSSWTAEKILKPLSELGK